MGTNVIGVEKYSRNIEARIPGEQRYTFEVNAKAISARPERRYNFLLSIGSKIALIVN